MKIRNYPRSCKFYLSHKKEKCYGIHLPLIHETDREGAQQKQVRRPADKISVVPGFRVKGNRTNRTGPFYYKSPEIVVHE